VLRHIGAGTLTLRHLSVSYGRVEEPGASGGCIWSAGSVALRAARVHHCAAISALSNDPSGRGGGVYAAGDVLLSDASVFRNLANNQDFAGGGGGGVAAEGNITLQHSQVYENIDFGKGGGLRGRSVSISYSLVQDNSSANGGGIYASDNLQVRKSTITGNIAGFEGGALLSEGNGGVYESTISGNEAFNGVPGIRTYGTFLNVWMSTVVDNVSNTPDCGGALNAPRIIMYSTIAANNACFEGGPGADIGGPPDAALGGRHNLIESSARHVPFDTINADPMLAPLVDNGGPTRTHALMAGSPAIDKGSNPLLRAYDQRGPGFPRVKGNGPDIGAFER
jgi:predicted outer membrane repeat protein